MVQSKAETVEEYLQELSPERRETVAVLRKIIVDNIPKGYKEVMQYGMIGYVVPLERYPETYNGQPLGIIALASQKNYLSLYLMNIYSDGDTQKWFTKEYKASGKKLNMGKSCVRFKKLEDLPLDLIAKAVSRTSVNEFIKKYESARVKSG
jgi:uncharacterized protein YdhG (YjbR/CyaY superfamily)